MASKKKSGPIKESLLQNKKAAVLGNSSSGKNTSMAGKLSILAVAVVVIAAAAFFLLQHGSGTKVAAAPAAQSIVGDQVAYATTDFQDGKARFYSYKDKDGLEIRYFVLKSSDGVIRAAFDACDVCWRSNKGYRQEGDFMVCNNCGRRFASVQVNQIQGGCNPSPLKREMDNGKVVLKIADIVQGRQYFTFSS